MNPGFKPALISQNSIKYLFVNVEWNAFNPPSTHISEFRIFSNKKNVLFYTSPDLLVVVGGGDSQGLFVCNNMCYQLIRSMCYRSEKGKILKASFCAFSFSSGLLSCSRVSDDSSCCSRESAGNLWMISSSSQFSEIASNWNSSTTHSQMAHNWKDIVILLLWNGFQLKC